MPPAAVTRRLVAFFTARIASRFVPPMSPSASTCVYRNSLQYGSSARTASGALIGSGVFQPWMTTCPPLLSTAPITLSTPTPSARARANSRSGLPSLNSAELAMIFFAPAARTSRARSTVRMPPPTWHDRAGAICLTIARLSPRPIAASRSITCTFGNRSNFRTHLKMSSSRIARRSPCTSCTTAPFWRSIDGMSILEAHGNAGCAEVRLQVLHAGFSIVKDRRGERCVGAAGREHVCKMLECAGAAGRNHWNRHGARDGRGQPAVESDLRTVPIDRCQQNFARPPVFGLLRPVNRVSIARRAAATHVDGRTIAFPFGIDGDQHGLAAISLGQRRDERRVRQCRRVQADLVRSGVDGCRRVGFRADAPADRQRNEQLAGDGANRLGQRATPFQRRRDVEDHELVNAFRVVPSGELGRIAGGPEAFEVDSLHDNAVTYVQTSNDAFRQHLAATPRGSENCAAPAGRRPQISRGETARRRPDRAGRWTQTVGRAW